MTGAEKFQKMSKTFGEKGIELVKEASRSNFNLAPFNEDVVRQVPASKSEETIPVKGILYHQIICLTIQY